MGEIEMFNINSYNEIAAEGLELFEKEQYALDVTDDPDGILLRSADLHGTVLPLQLKGIARAGAGTNNIPLKECSERGIVVFNTPGANANAVKELVLASLLLAARPILEGAMWAKTLKGPDAVQKAEAEKKRFVGSELAGKRLGVIGLGSIGAMVANDAYRLGMEVRGYDPYLSVDTAWKISRHIIRVESIEEVLETCDYITVHVPLMPETAKMIDAESIQRIKKNAVLLNFSRGGLVDIEAVVEALEERRLAQYMTDFVDERLLGIEGAVVLPHLGAATAEAETNCSVMAAETLKYFLETGNIRHSVNFPHVEMAFRSPIRLAIANRNVTNRIGQMSAILAEQGINIVNILNRSKGDYAYTLIDIDEIDADQLGHIANKVRQLEGILSVRVIRPLNRKEGIAHGSDQSV